MAKQPATNLYTTSITQAEILHGVMLLPAGRRRAAVEAVADAMFKEDFGGRILGFGGDAARLYARIASNAAARDARFLTSTRRSRQLQFLPAPRSRPAAWRTLPTAGSR